MSKGPEAFRTISEVAEDLDLPQHVLRFWETRFIQIKPLKRGGGRRYYRPDDVDLLRGIRQLLYGEGYTIKGVQRILKEQGAKFVIGAAREEVDAGAAPPQPRLMMDADDQADEDAFAAAPEDYAEARDGEEFETAQNGGVTPARTRRLVEQFMPNARSAGAEGSGLSGEDVRKLQGTLAELLECKRLLDQAR